MPCKFWPDYFKMCYSLFKYMQLIRNFLEVSNGNRFKILWNFKTLTNMKTYFKHFLSFYKVLYNSLNICKIRQARWCHTYLWRNYYFSKSRVGLFIGVLVAAHIFTHLRRYALSFFTHLRILKNSKSKNLNFFNIAQIRFVV